MVQIFISHSYNGTPPHPRWMPCVGVEQGTAGTVRPRGGSGASGGLVGRKAGGASSSSRQAILFTFSTRAT
eukprot:5546350-Prorocentrum_lima.AAC.1